MPRTPMVTTFLNGRVMALESDITRQDVMCIVNAANKDLASGLGVDQAIRVAAGPELDEACRQVRSRYPNGVPTGGAVLTPGGRLRAQYVIHTVGPIYGSHAGHEAELLGACYSNTLKLAAAHGITTIAFPAISTGIYGYPREEAARIASQTIMAFLNSDQTIRQVRLVFYTATDLDVFMKNHLLPSS